mgnify:CR=1 FL=1
MSDLVAQAGQLYELAWLGKSARVRELATARLDAAMHELQGTDPVRYQALCDEFFARAEEMAERRAALERGTEVQA